MDLANTLEPVVLAKGLSRSGEFRLILPERSYGAISERLSSIADLGGLLSPLYERTAEDLSRQYAVLLAEEEFAVVCVSPAKDRFGRRSIVIAGLSGRRERGSIPELAEASLQVARSRIDEIATAIENGSREDLGTATAQMAVSLRDFSSEPSIHPLFEGLAEADQFAGAATPLLLGLGADVVIGTYHEALDAQRKGFEVRACFDVRTSKFVSLISSESPPSEPTRGTQKRTGATLTTPAPLPGSRNTTLEAVEELIHRIENLERQLEHLRAGQDEMLRALKRKYWF